MIVEYGAVDATKRVLVHGAAGNVGAYAVQLARRVAHEVIATAFSGDVAYVQTRLCVISGPLHDGIGRRGDVYLDVEVDDNLHGRSTYCISGKHSPLFEVDGQLRSPFLMAHYERECSTLPHAGRRLEEQRADGKPVAVNDEFIVDDGAEWELEQLHVLDPIPLIEVGRDVVALHAGVLEQLLDRLDLLPDPGLSRERNLASLRRPQGDRIAADDLVVAGRESGLDQDPPRVMVVL